MRILFNFASRSRPSKFFAAIKNIQDNSASDNYLILAKLDLDDKTMTSVIPPPKEGLTKSKHLEIKWGHSTSKIHAINRDIPLEGWDILVNMSDDMYFTAEGFDMVIKSFSEPDIFLHFPDADADSQGVNTEDHISTLSIMDSVYFKRFGYVYHPAYQSLWCDNEATKVAKKLGRYKKVPIKIFEHRHPAWGKSVMDRQYKKTEALYHQDKLVFTDRQANGFP